MTTDIDSINQPTAPSQSVAYAEGFYAHYSLSKLLRGDERVIWYAPFNRYKDAITVVFDLHTSFTLEFTVSTPEAIQADTAIWKSLTPAASQVINYPITALRIKNSAAAPSNEDDHTNDHTFEILA